MAKTKITMFLDPDLIEWLDQNRDEETSRSAYLRILIRKDMKTKSRRKTAPVLSTDVFSSPTITANGALIYNSSASDAAVIVLAFGGDKTSTAGDFTVQFPTADASNAIIRIA